MKWGFVAVALLAACSSAESPLAPAVASPVIIVPAGDPPPPSGRWTADTLVAGGYLVVRDRVDTNGTSLGGLTQVIEFQVVQGATPAAALPLAFFFDDGSKYVPPNNGTAHTDNAGNYFVQWGFPSSRPSAPQHLTLELAGDPSTRVILGTLP